MFTALSIFFVIIFLLMNAFFVIAEFALVRVRRSQIEMAVAEGRKGAKNAQIITNNINAYLSACQLGITLASLAIGWLGEPAVSAVLEEPLLALGLPETVVFPVCVAVGFTLITSLHVIVGELIPKSFAIISTEKCALKTASPLRWFYRITYPIMVVFNGITNGVMRALGHDPANEHEVYTGEEIKLLIDESTESGLINPEQNEFVDNIFDLEDKNAAAIMTPRTDMIYLDVEDSPEENLDIVRKYRYSRYPLCRGSKDHVVGFVHIKDLYAMAPDTPMDEWPVREMPAVPETMSIARMLESMQEKRTEICVVIDEHGGTAGIATLSDVMEQIVGRIDDEYKHDVSADITEVAPSTYVIDGSLPVDKVVDLMGFEPLEATECETAGGLLLSLFDRIPNAGDTIIIEHEQPGEDANPIKVEFKVLEMDKLRIDKIECVIL